jgi:hypothetical protein
MCIENVPTVYDKSEDIITDLIRFVGVPRDLLPPRDRIENALKQLPPLLSSIREDLRDERLAKMCIAIGVGLFDSAINYVWNQTVIEIRKRIIIFGLDVVRQLKSKEYTERDIDNLQDSQLLDLASELNLISDEGYYFLNQCRDMRNNFSAAHPSIGAIDDLELIAYINRCIKYSLGNSEITIGVDLKELINSLRTSIYNQEQIDFWYGKISQTHPVQKEAIIVMLHGIYCDPNKQTIERTNVVNLSIRCRDVIDSKTISSIINQYEDYVAKSEADKKRASEDFFVRVGIFDSLRESNRHAFISKLCSQMMTIHKSMNNFYNEPPFAEYLLMVSKQAQIPDTVKNEFVDTVVSCAVGNEYGVSSAAIKYYDDMIKNFSPKEIEIMLKIPDAENYTAYKVTKYPRCIYQYKQKILLLNASIIPASLMPLYQTRIR